MMTANRESVTAKLGQGWQLKYPLISWSWMPRSPGKFVSVASDGGKVKKAGLFKKSDEKNDQRREGGRAMGMNDLMGTHLQEEAGWRKKKMQQGAGTGQ